MSDKIYLIMQGEYSDINVARCFLDINKAEAYLKTQENAWLSERFISDNIEIIPVWYVDFTYYGGYEDYEDSYDFEIYKTNKSDINLNETGKFWGDGSITLKAYVYEEDIDEKEIIKRYKKICRDILTQIKSLKEVEGWTDVMIKEWFNEKYGKMQEDTSDK